MKTILKYLKPHSPKMFLGFLSSFCGTILQLLLPLILSFVLKNVMRSTVKGIIFWGILMIACSILACLCNVTANRIAAKVGSNFAENMRRDLFKKTLHLSAAQTDKFTVPSLESRITTDTYNVHRFVNMAQRMGVRAPIILTGSILITLVMDAYLSLIMIALLPVTLLIVYLVSKKGVPMYTKVQSAVDKMVRVVREDVIGIRVVKALSKTDYEHRRYNSVNRDMMNSELKAGVVMNGLQPIMNAFINIGSVAVVALSSGRVAKGLSDPETVIAFMQYFTHISASLMAATRMMTMFTKCAASARRIEEVLNTDEEILVHTEAEYPKKDTKARILFDNVCFSYMGKKNNLENINFEVAPGGSLGIIGATGSGKSSIIRLLLRFYDTDSGAVYINGRDVRSIEKDELYSMFGSVQQYDFLYSDTIAENIRFGRNISDEDVYEAAKTAQAYDFITEFKDGFSHMLSQQGTNISGGQKQRLLISRALASKPDILILDDSSSALDYKTDAALRLALKENMGNTTLVTVAQRVSSVKDCDLIIVMEYGCILGIGTHETLMQTCDTYREISESQMGGAFVE